MVLNYLRIGEIATRCGVTIDTLRYYERIGLLARASRTSGGFRLFDHTAIERVLFIKEAQELGFSLDEIKELLTTGGVEECKHVRDLLKLKIRMAIFVSRSGGSISAISPHSKRE